jgi:NAD(P)-dependent dehydrogenase (short-subunit alcohol dehydrogenase family)
MLGSVTEEQFDTTFGLNVRGTLFTVQNALPLFRDGGSIVMNGSIASVKGIPGRSVYGASKAECNVRSCSTKWGRHGFDWVACGREACRGVDTPNRSQNYKCRTSIRACCLIS